MSNMHNPPHPGETLRGWLAMQSACDLWNAERAAKAALKKIKQMEMALV